MAVRVVVATEHHGGIVCVCIELCGGYGVAFHWSVAKGDKRRWRYKSFSLGFSALAVEYEEVGKSIYRGSIFGLETKYTHSPLPNAILFPSRGPEPPKSAPQTPESRHPVHKHS